MLTVYVLRTSDGFFYIGHTADLKQRIIRHNRGECRYTKSRLPVKLIYKEEFISRPDAVKREKQLKSWKSSKAIKNLISDNGGPIV